MCCCGKPNVNGMANAYSWDGHHFSTRQPSPPPLGENDTLLYDEPGRCGGMDAHSHHFCLVKSDYGHALLVQHGGGNERIALGVTARLAIPSLASLDSGGRYWWFHTLYSTHSDAKSTAAGDRDAHWRKAAATGRVKTRKIRGKGLVKVWIEPEVTNVATVKEFAS